MFHSAYNFRRLGTNTINNNKYAMALKLNYYCIVNFSTLFMTCTYLSVFVRLKPNFDLDISLSISHIEYMRNIHNIDKIHAAYCEKMESDLDTGPCFPDKTNTEVRFDENWQRVFVFI